MEIIKKGNDEINTRKNSHGINCATLEANFIYGLNIIELI